MSPFLLFFSQHTDCEHRKTRLKADMLVCMLGLLMLFVLIVVKNWNVMFKYTFETDK